MVTGASRGIGAALAREAAAKGARVTLVARRLESLQELADELGGQPFPCDLAASERVATVIDEIEQSAGPIDVLINNAAFNEVGPFIGRSASCLRQHLDTNLYAPIELSRQLIPRMNVRKQGTVVMISSVGGEVAIANNQLYNATKAGLNMFTATLQRELTGTAVNVLLVLLGAVDTDMLAAGKQDPLIAAFTEKVKVKPLSTQHVAREVVAALMKGRRSLVLPRNLLPLLGLRQIPTRVNDLMMKHVR